MWKNAVIKITEDLKILKTVRDSEYKISETEFDELIEIETIHNDCEANKFTVKQYRKNKSLFTVEFFKYNHPKRRIKELTEKELICVIKMYCIPQS